MKPTTAHYIESSIYRAGLLYSPSARLHGRVCRRYPRRITPWLPTLLQRTRDAVV